MVAAWGVADVSTTAAGFPRVLGVLAGRERVFVDWRDLEIQGRRLRTAPGTSGREPPPNTILLK